MDNFLTRLCKRYVFPNAAPKIQKSLSLGSKRKDIVIILGWGGAKHKNFNKILNYYITRDVTVVCSTMPQYVPSFVRRYYETEIAAAVQEIRSKDDPSYGSKLCGHVFSNNGAWSLATLCQRTDLPPFDKLIYDSAPALYYEQIPISLEVERHSRVITSVLLEKPQYEGHSMIIFIKAALYAFVPLWRTINILQKVFKENVVTDYLVLNIILRDKSPAVPTYFIYSSGDKLVPSTCVRDFKLLLQARNIPTFEKDFGDEVPHTASFFKHSEEYKAIIDSFFDLKKGPALSNRYLRV